MTNRTADLGTTMKAVYLPGDSTVNVRDVPVPSPGPGEVLLRVGASSICGSDVRAIYREHTGTGAEAYQGVIAGHEPAGTVVAVGAGVQGLGPGERVAVYHINGCGSCSECVKGYEIGCSDPSRAAYGWQRDGGHAQWMVADARNCLKLPDALTLVDGALAACAFGTAWEALLRIDVGHGEPAVLITGLGPVGLAVGMLAKALGAQRIVGCDPSAARRHLAQELGLVHQAVVEPPRGEKFSAAVDCSGVALAREGALRTLADWGRLALVGEGGRLEVDVSPMIIHKQVTIRGSWVTSLVHMRELLEFLAVRDLHPEQIVTDRFTLEEAGAAYELASRGTAGKVCLVPQLGATDCLSIGSA